MTPSRAPTMAACWRRWEGAGRRQEALEHYDRALALQPDFADAIVNRAAALCALERPAEALACLEPLVAAQPRNVFALYNRAVALAGLARFEEAVTACDVALA